MILMASGHCAQVKPFGTFLILHLQRALAKLIVEAQRIASVGSANASHGKQLLWNGRSPRVLALLPSALALIKTVCEFSNENRSICPP